jgi:hypothetical protein
MLFYYTSGQQQTKEEIEYSQDAFKVTDCKETILIEAKYLFTQKDKIADN